MPAGQGGGDLNEEGGDEGGPAEPHHDGQGVDEGLGGNALTVERPAHLGGRGDVVRKGPADEVPERPGHPDYQAGEQGERSETFDQLRDLGHGFACSAVAVPLPDTVRWSIPERESN